jgi:ATP-dependent Lon protease
MAVSSIPIIGQRQIYAVTRVQKALDELDEAAQPHLARQLTKMINTGGTRFVAKPSSPKCLDGLYESCPNFSGVLDDLRKYVALAIDGDEPLSFMPILLLGDPGVGKTHFGKALGTALGTEFQFVSMATLSASFILSGNSSSWKDSKPGMVAKAMIEGLLCNPLFMLDEIDKTGGDAHHDPLGPLYSLLENETAAEFVDEYLEVPMDTRGITWVFTANDIRSIPDPILSRMAVYEVPSPTPEQARTIAGALYRQLLREHRWKFAAELGDDVLDTVAAHPPREMRKRLLDAMGNAKLAGRDVVKPDDFGRAVTARKPSIGFMNSGM